MCYRCTRFLILITFSDTRDYSRSLVWDFADWNKAVRDQTDNDNRHRGEAGVFITVDAVRYDNVSTISAIVRSPRTCTCIYQLLAKIRYTTVILLPHLFPSRLLPTIYTQSSRHAAQNKPGSHSPQSVSLSIHHSGPWIPLPRRTSRSIVRVLLILLTWYIASFIYYIYFPRRNTRRLGEWGRGNIPWDGAGARARGGVPRWRAFFFFPADGLRSGSRENIFSPESLVLFLNKSSAIHQSLRQFHELFSALKMNVATVPAIV